MSKKLSFFPLLLLILVLFAAPNAWSAPPDEILSQPEPGRSAWSSLLEEGIEAGTDGAQLEKTMVQLINADISVEKARLILSPAYEAARAGLPSEHVLEKINEGILKGANPNTIITAAQKRFRYLEKAKLMIKQNGYKVSSRSGNGLLLATAMALESGVPRDNLEPVVKQGAGKSPAQMRIVVEAGEALHLAGLDPQVVQALMTDCLKRKLRRTEVMRVVRSARENHGQGKRGADVLDAVWGKEKTKSTGKPEKAEKIKPEKAGKSNEKSNKGKENPGNKNQ